MAGPVGILGRNKTFLISQVQSVFVALLILSIVFPPQLYAEEGKIPTAIYTSEINPDDGPVFSEFEGTFEYQDEKGETQFAEIEFFQVRGQKGQESVALKAIKDRTTRALEENPELNLTTTISEYTNERSNALEELIAQVSPEKNKVRVHEIDKDAALPYDQDLTTSEKIKNLLQKINIFKRTTRYDFFGGFTRLVISGTFSTAAQVWSNIPLNDAWKVGLAVGGGSMMFSLFLPQWVDLINYIDRYEDPDLKYDDAKILKIAQKLHGDEFAEKVKSILAKKAVKTKWKYMIFLAAEMMFLVGPLVLLQHLGYPPDKGFLSALVGIILVANMGYFSQGVWEITLSELFKRADINIKSSVERKKNMIFKATAFAAASIVAVTFATTSVLGDYLDSSALQYFGYFGLGVLGATGYAYRYKQKYSGHTLKEIIKLEAQRLKERFSSGGKNNVSVNMCADLF